MRAGRVLFVTYLLLAIWSLLLVYSTSYGVAVMRYKVEPSYFFNRQLLFYGLGFLGLLVCSRINVQLFYLRRTLRILAGSLLGLLLLVLLTGSAANNAQRWLSIAGVTFQPTEMVKLLLILVIATVFLKKGCGVRVQYWLLGFLFLTVGLVFLAAGSWHCTDFRCYWGRFVFNERSWPHTPCASCNLDFWSLITCSNADLLLSPRLF